MHEEHLVGLLYGQRALCIGALMPLNYVGTSEHSYAKLTPFKRLVHTGNAFEKIYFGTRAEADRVLAYVRKLHHRVKGTLSADVGITPAGTPYSALDPELMLWTVAVIADSAQYFYELLVRPLSAREREALWQDYIGFGELFGMPREAVPASYPEFRAWYEGKLASDDVCLTDEARYIGYATAFEIPLPRLHQPGKRVHDLLMLGSLPPRVRELYGIPYSPRSRGVPRRIGRRAVGPALPPAARPRVEHEVLRTRRPHRASADRARHADAPGPRRRAGRDHTARSRRVLKATRRRRRPGARPKPRST